MREPASGSSLVSLFCTSFLLYFSMPLLSHLPSSSPRPSSSNVPSPARPGPPIPTPLLNPNSPHRLSILPFLLPPFLLLHPTSPCFPSHPDLLPLLAALNPLFFLLLLCLLSMLSFPTTLLLFPPVPPLAAFNPPAPSSTLSSLPHLILHRVPALLPHPDPSHLTSVLDTTPTTPSAPLFPYSVPRILFQILVRTP